MILSGLCVSTELFVRAIIYSVYIAASSPVLWIWEKCVKLNLIHTCVKLLNFVQVVIETDSGTWVYMVAKIYWQWIYKTMAVIWIIATMNK